jgi:phosphatidylinositol-3-phosphatase
MLTSEPRTEPTATEPRSTLRCAECATRLAHDQYYCVECGARRGPLPAQIVELIGAIREQGPAPSLAPGTPLADSLADSAPAPRGFAFPGPRAVAVAVMGMLGFGVIVGSLVGGTSVETLASAPLIVVGLSHPTPSAAVQSAVASQDTGSGGAGPAAATSAAPAAGAQQAAQVSASPSTSTTPATANGGSSSTSTLGLPPVKHVFLIVLSDRGFAHSFGATPSGGYLSGALRRQGELVQNYYAVAGAPLANELALVSGQGPTAQTAADCPVVSHIGPGKKGARGQVLGTGCVYPATTKTLATQLTSAGDTWKAYVQGISTSSPTACRVPRLGTSEPQTAGPHTTYLPWRNPFVYFRSLTTGGACRKDEVGIGHLANDLKSATTTPSLAYIIPAPCAAGSEAPCKPNAQPGLAAANRFLKSVVPEIKRSPAYKAGGLIAITFDQAPQTGPDADPSACCLSPSYPNLRRLASGPPPVPPAGMGAGTTTPATTTGTSTTSTTGPTTTPASSLGSGSTTPTGGGGQVGLLLISPYVKADSIDVVDYFNHFSLLGMIENLFGLHRLGYAGAPALQVPGAPVFNRYAG